MSLNRIVLMGRIASDIEKKTTNSGVSVVTVSLAVDRDYKQGDERQTDFINCVFWRQRADALEKYSGKGRMIAVEGRLEIRKWEDKEGNKRSAAEVQVDNWYFADSKKDGSTPAGQSYPAPSGGGFTEPEDFGGELPF